MLNNARLANLLLSLTGQKFTGQKVFSLANKTLTRMFYCAFFVCRREGGCYFPCVQVCVREVR